LSGVATQTTESAIHRLLNQAAAVASEIPPHTMKLPTGAGVSIAEDAHPATQVFQTAQAILQCQNAPQLTQPPETLVEWLLETVSKVPKPVRVVVLYVLLPYVISVVANLTTPGIRAYMESHARRANHQAIRIVKSRIKEISSVPISGDMRFVTVMSLDVRSRPKRRSTKLHTLAFGEVVRFVDRRRGWALVEFPEGANGDMLRGWVFARYLGRLPMPPAAMGPWSEAP